MFFEILQNLSQGTRKNLYLIYFSYLFEKPREYLVKKNKEQKAVKNLLFFKEFLINNK